VTDARTRLAELEAAGHPLSFAAFVLHAVARAVDADHIVHGYRRRNRLVLFDDVDVNFQVESELAGQKVVKSVIIRAANRKTVEELSAEIRNAQRRSRSASVVIDRCEPFSSFLGRFARWPGA
jgi:pyruvate/2-oxoglutarate dehydrogenase complex dihydrolipoamide acyltransferase (E2) component